MSIQVNMNRAALYRQTKSSRNVSNEFVLSKKQQSSVNLFFAAFIINCLSYLTAVTNNPVLSPAACQGFQAIALAMIIFAWINLVKFKFDNKYLEVVFIIFIIYSVTIVIRDPNYTYDIAKKVMFDPGMGMMGYLTPLVMLFPRSIAVYKKAFKVVAIFGILFFVYIIVYFNIVHDSNWKSLIALSYIENFFGVLAFPSGFILLTFLYHPKKIKRLAFAVMFIGLYFLIFRARRGAMFLCLTSLAGAGMIYLVHTKRTVLVITLSVIFIFVGSVFVSNVKLPSMFDFLMSRGDEDTRSIMEKYMKEDLTQNEWLFGKGINGKYYCPVILDPNDLSMKRDIIETGYLQIILKGGLVHIILFCLIFLPAIFLGFFRSSNILSKAGALYILLAMVYTYPTIVTGFGLFYIWVWLSVGICYSKKIRNMSDEDITKYLSDVKPPSGKKKLRNAVS
ncbi:hypothetical protein [Ferruginibacter sp. SUN106]|uniref:hypothetical protein n=1 Tax=Ferruginibacter sp. SUN106 TaxID=2978348 RepID=UPI003D35DEAF